MKTPFCFDFPYGADYCQSGHFFERHTPGGRFSRCDDGRCGHGRGGRHAPFADAASCGRHRHSAPSHPRHRHHDGPGKEVSRCAGRRDRGPDGGRDDAFDGRRGHGRGGRSGPRMLMHGDLRLLLIALIEPQPRHGYELIRLIEEMFHGHYSPSPGVIYPTLSLLEDLGYVGAATQDGRKRYFLTASGAEFVNENREAIDATLARSRHRARAAARAELPDPVRQSMHRIREALSERAVEWNPEEAERIAAILADAAERIGQGAKPAKNAPAPDPD